MTEIKGIAQKDIEKKAIDSKIQEKRGELVKLDEQRALAYEERLREEQLKDL